MSSRTLRISSDESRGTYAQPLAPVGTDRLWRTALATSAPTNTVGDSLWIDMWIDGNVESASFVRDRARTVTGVRAAVFDPVGNYAVAPGSGVIHDGKRDSGYGNDLIVE